MSDFASSTRATILFDGPPEMDFVSLINELKRPFRNIALDFDEIEMDENLYALFTSDRLSLRISRGQIPVTAESLAGTGRPARCNSTATEIAALKRDYHDTLLVSVADGMTRTVPERLRVSVCYHVVRHLLQHYEAAAVQWHHTNTLFSADEFGNPTDAQRPVAPRRASAESATRRSARPEKVVVAEPVPEPPSSPARASADDANPFAAGYMGVAENHTRLDESFAQVVDAESAPEGAETHQRSWKDVLPHIAPTDDSLRTQRQSIFASDLIEIEDVKFEAPEHEPALAEQLTVYVMTLTMMVLAFPAGFAMLIYNILAGEDLKMTSRAMALTGFGMSIHYAGVGETLIAMI